MNRKVARIDCKKCIYLSRRIASGSWDKRLCVWDIQSGRILVLKLYFCPYLELFTKTSVIFFKDP